MKQSIETLKSYFEAKDTPIQQNFEDLIDSYVHQNEATTTINFPNTVYLASWGDDVAGSITAFHPFKTAEGLFSALPQDNNIWTIVLLSDMVIDVEIPKRNLVFYTEKNYKLTLSNTEMVYNGGSSETLTTINFQLPNGTLELASGYFNGVNTKVIGNVYKTHILYLANEYFFKDLEEIQYETKLAVVDQSLFLVDTKLPDTAISEIKLGHISVTSGYRYPRVVKANTHTIVRFDNANYTANKNMYIGYGAVEMYAGSCTNIEEIVRLPSKDIYFKGELINSNICTTVYDISADIDIKITALITYIKNENSTVGPFPNSAYSSYPRVTIEATILKDESTYEYMFDFNKYNINTTTAKGTIIFKNLFINTPAKFMKLSEWCKDYEFQGTNIINDSGTETEPSIVFAPLNPQNPDGTTNVGYNRDGTLLKHGTIHAKFISSNINFKTNLNQF